VASVVALSIGGEEGGRKRLAAGGIAGGDGEAADEVGVDAFAALGAALHGADQVAELEAGRSARVGSSLGAELGRGLDQRRADRRQVAALLVLGQALADRRLAVEPDLTRRGGEGVDVSAGAFEAGDRGRAVLLAATAASDSRQQAGDPDPGGRWAQALRGKMVNNLN
jgi:hypothetical protein